MIKVTNLNSTTNAVVSGIFFGGKPTSSTRLVPGHGHDDAG